MHSHWTIYGYKTKRKGSKGEFLMDEFVEILVDAENEKEALKKAKKILTRKFYYTHKVYSCEIDHKGLEEMQLEQMAIQKLFLKELKKSHA